MWRRHRARHRGIDWIWAAYHGLVVTRTTLYQTKALDSSGQLRRRIDLVGNARFVRNVIEAAEEERGKFDAHQLGFIEVLRVGAVAFALAC